MSIFETFRTNVGMAKAIMLYSTSQSATTVEDANQKLTKAIELLDGVRNNDSYKKAIATQDSQLGGLAVCVDCYGALAQHKPEKAYQIISQWLSAPLLNSYEQEQLKKKQHYIFSNHVAALDCLGAVKASMPAAEYQAKYATSEEQLINTVLNHPVSIEISKKDSPNNYIGEYIALGYLEYLSNNTQQAKVYFKKQIEIFGVDATLKNEFGQKSNLAFYHHQPASYQEYLNSMMQELDLTHPIQNSGGANTQKMKV